MEFELWLFAVKQLAQNYAMCQMIYSQLSDDEKAELRREYEASVGGGSSSQGDAAKNEKSEKEIRSEKTIKEYRDLLGSFHNAMSIVERFLEKNNVKYLDSALPIDTSNPDEVFLRRSFLNLEMSTLQTMQFLTYISKPVQAEGELALDASGRYSVGGQAIEEGMFLEFFHVNRWEVGRFCKGAEAPYGYFFLGFRNELFNVKLDGLKVRLRG